MVVATAFVRVAVLIVVGVLQLNVYCMMVVVVGNTRTTTTTITTTTTTNT